jgi:hypothetical protein
VKVLVACEFSGIVRDAFIAKGHDAISCDLEDTEIPGPHFKGNVIQFLKSTNWDLLIAHPPCTFTCVSGNGTYANTKEREQGIEFFRFFLEADVPFICVEHPVSVISTAIRPPDQYIQPWQFGHGETKKTGLWLKNLPKLIPTNVVAGREPRVHHERPSPNRWKERSRTYTGVAEAMASQWSNLIE